MKNTPEGKIKRKVVEVLKRQHVWYFFPAANGFGRAGIPDIIAIVAGVFVGIECKADVKKKPTVLQVKCGEEIVAAGGKWELVRCQEDVDKLESLVEEIRNNAGSRHCESAST